MKEARIICIGKIKTDYWRNACEYYAKLLKQWRKLEITELRDADGALSQEQRKDQEEQRILAAIGNRDLPIILSETGKSLTSREFADFIRDCDERLQKRPAFIVGGPFGLASTIIKKDWPVISLSAMTFPHELARVVLLEQIYRAEAILHNRPYHH